MYSTCIIIKLYIMFRRRCVNCILLTTKYFEKSNIFDKKRLQLATHQRETKTEYSQNICSTTMIPRVNSCSIEKRIIAFVCPWKLWYLRYHINAKNHYFTILKIIYTDVCTILWNFFWKQISKCVGRKPFE